MRGWINFQQNSGVLERAGRRKKVIKKIISVQEHINSIRLFFMATVMLCFTLITVVPAKSNDEPAAENTQPGVTATRCVHTSERIIPGSTFPVTIMLHANTEIKQLELHEVMPGDWIVDPLNSADAAVTLSQTDPSKISWIWKDIHTGTSKTVFYHVSVPLSAKERNYPIKSKIISDKSKVTVDGEITVSVKKSSEDTTKNKIDLWLALFIGIVITGGFFAILILGWLKEKKIDKGIMRRAMAGTFVIGYTFLVMLTMWTGFFQKEVILMYIQLVSMVVAFYFGSKVGSETPDATSNAKSPRSDPAEPPTLNSITPPKDKGEV